MEITDYELFIILELLDECNLNCEHCFNAPFKKTFQNKIMLFLKKNLPIKKSFKNIDINILVSNLEKLNKKSVILLTGGEPFLFPGFIELCKLLTRKNNIMLNTNLTHKNIYDFANEVNPAKVHSVSCSLHISELERLNLVEDFIAKVKYLKKKGFKTKVIYIMYPPLFKRFRKDYQQFKSQGIIIYPKFFRGYYKSETYPQAYTQAQKDLMLKFGRELFNKALIFSDSYVKGKKCLAGKSAITIESDGTVLKCYGDKKKLGNIIDGDVHLYSRARACEMEKCTYPHVGSIYILEK